MGKESDTGKTKTLRLIMLGGFFCFTCCAMVGSLLFGSANISFQTILHTLIGNVSTTDEMVIWNIRFPRNIVGALVGGNLAVSGAILQAVMKNPLADPGIVGVSSGAGLAGVIMLIFMPEASLLLTPVAFIGAMLSACAVYSLAWKNGIRPTRIILAGVAVSAFLGSGISALLVFYSDKVQGALLWMVGGLSARSWPQVEALFPYTVLGLIFALAGCKALTILSLGDETARGLGVPVEKVRFSMTAVAALLAAGAVSIAGLIGFVGLVVPHIVRLIVGTDYKYVIPGSAILGAGVLVFCDTLGRILFSPVEIPAGIIMAFLGAPFFLYLLRRSSLKPDVGRVEVAEKALSSFHTNEMARQVAFLPQVHEIPKDMTAEELVSCGRYPYQHWWTGVSTHDRDVIQSAMQRTNTLHLKDRLAANLSGGERQRVWIAMALAQEPKILILDEPTTYLDICHQLEVLELVSKLNREENITIIMVLHDINQAVRYSSEIFVLENGIIERQGTPIDVMTHDAIADIFEVDADVEMRRGRPSISINGLLD